MAITLNHTIVPAHDKEASAKFFAHMFGLKYEGAMSHFAPVRINETLTLDFDNWPKFEMHHYAFQVGDAWSSTQCSVDQGGRHSLWERSVLARRYAINTRRGGRGVYFKDGYRPHCWSS